MPPESSITITQPPEFEYDVDSSSDYGFKWLAWIRRFDVWMQASGLTTQSEARKIALLLASAGEKIDEIYHSNVNNASTLEQVKTGIKEFLNPKKDPMFETIQFRAMKQHENEPIDEFCKRLRHKAIDYNFEDDQDRQIYLQIMSNCSRNDIREAALMGTTASTQWNLDRLLKHARSQEATNKQSKYIVNLSSKTSLGTNHTRHNPKQKELRRASKKSYDERLNHRQGYVKPICSNCGYNHADGLCRAKGKTCSHCKKLNHFSTVCESKLSGKPPSQTAMPYKQRQNRTNYQQRTHHTRESTADVSILVRSASSNRLSTSSKSGHEWHFTQIFD